MSINKSLITLVLLAASGLAQTQINWNTQISNRPTPGATSYAAGGGTAQAQTLNLSPAISSYVAGLEISWLPAAANTGSAPTIEVNGLTTVTIVKVGGGALAAHDLTTTAVAFAIYDGTYFELQNPQTQLNSYVAGAGTAQAQTAAPVPAFGALATGIQVAWLPLNANSGSGATLAVNGLAAKTIVKVGGAALAANDLTTTAIAFAIYDGTYFELQNPQTQPTSAVSSFTGDGVIINNSASAGSVTDTLVNAPAHKFLGNNTASSAAPAYDYLGTQDVSPNMYVAGGGTANAQTATLVPAATSLVAGLVVRWLPTAANSNSTPTLAVSGLTAKTIVKVGGAALANNDLTTTAIAFAIYDGTYFELQNPQGATGSGVPVLANTPTLITPEIGAATGTSLLLSGIGDGLAPITVTTGASCTLGTSSGCNATAYKSGYTFNEEATAGTAITYTLPTAAAGLQYCVGNAYNGSAADTGTIEILTSASGQFIIFTDGTLSATGGYVISSGAAADFACVVGVDSTHWYFRPGSGTWAKH